jgi:hypothetical protein
MLEFAEVVDTKKAFKTGQIDEKTGKPLFKGSIEVKIGGERAIMNRLQNEYAAPAFFNKRIPLVGEKVFVFKGPGINASAASIKTSQLYYFTILNGIDNPTLHVKDWNFERKVNNSLNSPTPEKIIYDDREYAYTMKKNATSAKMLQPYEGDDIWEGRFGQSIRFSRHYGNSYKPGPDIYEIKNTNYWPGKKENDSIIIIKTKKVESGKKFDIEDISKDASSIYLTTSQKILKFKAGFNKNKDVKTIPSWDKGSQIIVDSDRIVLNAKNDNAYLIGKNKVVISGNAIMLQTKKYKVDLDTFMDWLNSAYAELFKLATAQKFFTTAMGPTGASTNASVISKIHKAEWSKNFKTP